MAQGDIQYRILPPDQWGQAVPLIEKSLGKPISELSLPTPNTASILVTEAFDDTDTPHIVGLVFLQLAYHLEPFMCMKGFEVSFVRMSELVDQLLPNGTVYYSQVETTPEAHALARRAGLDDLSGVKMMYRMVNED